jgi:SAM-dependent methyltransferase
MLVPLTKIAPLLISPDDGAPIEVQFDQAGRARGVTSAGRALPMVGDLPVLLPIASVADPSRVEQSVVARQTGRIHAVLSRIVNGSNPVARQHAGRIIEACTRDGGVGRVLVIGGGTRGNGTEPLYDDPRIETVAFDIYASSNVQFVADAHRIPLVDSSVDAVWIQAVLEHVIDPAQVVAELTRVLRPGGLVYAETPFMQQVHERAFDFTRFTERGHRWLFREFEQLGAGAAAGPGTALFWSLRYLFGALLRNRRLGNLVASPLFPLRFLDHLVPAAHAIDSASVVYFFGRRSGTQIALPELIEGFSGV